MISQQIITKTSVFLGIMPYSLVLKVLTRLDGFTSEKANYHHHENFKFQVEYAFL